MEDETTSVEEIVNDSVVETQTIANNPAVTRQNQPGTSSYATMLPPPKNSSSAVHPVPQPPPPQYHIQQTQQMQPVQQQQQQQQPTFVVVTQPAPQVIRAQDTNFWTTEMCDCCSDCGICLAGFCCPPCHWCYLAAKLNECSLGPCLCGILFCVPMRTKLRVMYGIRGSIMDDCCGVCWCSCCVSTQMHREFNYYKHL